MQTWLLFPFALAQSLWLCCINQPKVEFPLPVNGLIQRVEFAAFQVP